MKNKYWLLTILIALTLTMIFVFLFKWMMPCRADVEVVVAEPKLKYNIPVDSFYVEESTVKQNEYFSGIFASLGVSNNDLSRISMLDQSVFDARGVRAGNKYTTFYSSNDSVRKLCYLVYERNPVDYCVFCFTDSVCVYNGRNKVEVKTKRSEAKITSSLWNAVVDNSIDINVALNLSEIYAWTIDFFGLQEGDRFSVIYDEYYVDSVSIGIGQIHAARFLHADKNHYAIYYEQDSAGSYWDENGNSLKRAFLKAPLQFSRISSNFTYARKHPVLRIVRPHTGVDYAAPAGTPVVSIGDGVVLEIGYKGGGGNTVKIRHNNTYTTAYLHLSKFAPDIKTGGRINQGQLIGYVGSTGLSTGPHLDFRVWKNGTPIDPLTMESPSSEPIAESNELDFFSKCSVYIHDLGGWNR